MKIQKLLILIIMILASCMPTTTSPLPNTKLVQTPIELSKTPTTIPAIITPGYPKQTPTSIHTPHAIPTPIGQITLDRAHALYDERVEYFENSLQFTIKISDISTRTCAAKNITLYLLTIEGLLTNISNKPVVTKRTLRYGFVMEPEVYLGLSYNGIGLEFIECCVDGILHTKQDDYLVLQPNESQRYTWVFSIPTTLRDATKQEIPLSGKTISITAVYVNLNVGFDLQDEEGHLIVTKNEQGESIAHQLDMNAWVGHIESNSAECLFP